MMGEPIKVLVVDDSILMRGMLKDLLSEDERIEVVGTAPNASVAYKKIFKLNPDIMTLDIDMPKMNGYTFLKKIMNENPMPVIILSGLTQKGAGLTVKCLEAGAVDVIAKPTYKMSRDMGPVAEELKKSIKNIYDTRTELNLRQEHKKKIKRKIYPAESIQGAGSIIAMGVSIGGPKILPMFFPEFPENTPPILIVQHMPAGFTDALAKSLNRISRIYVKEAEDREDIRVGTALVAPGDYHMLVKKVDDRLKVFLNKDERVNGVRPSIDVLFNSLARECGSSVNAVILTGMGSDGVEGLKYIKKRGGRTFAQDKKSCVVYGMPRIAVEQNCVDEIIDIDIMVEKLIKTSKTEAYKK
ncbi:MAG: chemotaxis response regulator protein-glutamate methylesterase [Elusimicrobia bacterium]|nr:chemotaxis response regulator protein-glutamate methylesterase [Elusimicrobiota bacterium]